MSTQFAIDPKLDFVIERFVDAPRRLVWEALTKPEHLKEWYMPKEWGRVAKAEMDLRPGGVFRIDAPPTPTPTATASPTPTLTPPPLTCVGDCGGDGEVTINDLLLMVNIALGNLPVSSCTAGDANHDGEITINEILAAVNNALNGCPLEG